jgi:hypothetical protein
LGKRISATPDRLPFNQPLASAANASTQSTAVTTATKEKYSASNILHHPGTRRDQQRVSDVEAPTRSRLTNARRIKLNNRISLRRV